MADREFLDYLHASLGPDYKVILKAFLERYRFISLDPVLVRLRKPDNTTGNIYMDPNGYRYFYLKAAIITPGDYNGGAIKYDTLRFQAQKLMLEHYKTYNQAIDRGYFSIWTIFPAELRKMARRYSSVMSLIELRPSETLNRSLGAKITINSGILEEIEKYWEDVVDPYLYSEDDYPTNLKKPIAENPPVKQFIEPPTQTIPIKESEEDSPVDFSLIKDADI